jgi:hypothetical protein
MYWWFMNSAPGAPKKSLTYIFIAYVTYDHFTVLSIKCYLVALRKEILCEAK